MTKDEALKLALEALEEAWYHVGTFQPTEKAIDLYDEARTAIKEALSEPEQYPQIAINPEIVGYVAPQRKTFNHHEFGYWWFEYGSGLHPLEGEDQEEHSYRVATAAWQAAHGIKGD